MPALQAQGEGEHRGGFLQQTNLPMMMAGSSPQPGGEGGRTHLLMQRPVDESDGEGEARTALKRLEKSTLRAFGGGLGRNLRRCDRALEEGQGTNQQAAQRRMRCYGIIHEIHKHLVRRALRTYSVDRRGAVCNVLFDTRYCKCSAVPCRNTIRPLARKGGRG